MQLKFIWVNQTGLKAIKVDLMNRSQSSQSVAQKNCKNSTDIRLQNPLENQSNQLVFNWQSNFNWVRSGYSLDNIHPSLTWNLSSGGLEPVIFGKCKNYHWLALFSYGLFVSVRMKLMYSPLQLYSPPSTICNLDPKSSKGLL